MIFLTVGSHEPFDRLIKAMDEWCGGGSSREVFGQITRNGSYRPANFPWVATLNVEEYRARCEAAELLVSHAGMGSIITALDLGKPIVIMPRRGHLRETRNDHQFHTAQKFRGKPGIFVADDETCLASEITEALESTGRDHHAGHQAFAQDRLLKFLAGALKG